MLIIIIIYNTNSGKKMNRVHSLKHWIISPYSLLASCSKRESTERGMKHVLSGLVFLSILSPDHDLHMDLSYCGASQYTWGFSGIHH